MYRCVSVTFDRKAIERFGTKRIEFYLPEMGLVDMFVRQCIELFDEAIGVTDKTKTSCVLTVRDAVRTEEALRELLESVCTQLGVCDAQQQVTIDVQMIGEEEAPRPVIERIDALYGAEEFKKRMHEIQHVAPSIRKRGLYETFSFQCYVFAINDGYGLSTYLELFAQLLKETNLFPLPEKNAVAELRLAPPKRDKTLVEQCERTFREHKLVCLDISEWLAHLREKQFVNLLNYIEDHIGENIVVFRVPFLEGDAMHALMAALEDVLFVHYVPFEPMDIEILICHAKLFMHKLGFDATQDVWELFEERIAQEKSDGRFYGLNTVRKIVREMVYRKQLSDVASGKESAIIGADDIVGLIGVRDDKLSASEMLDKLVALDEVKRQIRGIVDAVLYPVASGNGKRPSIHMSFTGNPGTGKTTVARIIGRYLKEEGALRNGFFFEYKGRDFCGRYIGETAPKTSAMCRDAYGSVLFIDEAYSLYRGEESSPRDFGKEALDTLVAEMENHRDDLVVIFAGYEDEMDMMMEGNRGIRDRIQYHMHFPNYTREELTEIFMRMAQDWRLTCEDALRERVAAYFADLPEAVLEDKSFSNARFVRNLLERACAKVSSRCRHSGEQPCLTTADFELAIEERDFRSMLEKKPRARLGF